MKRILPSRPIIQTTLFNITVSVFVIIMILMALFGQSFWEKEFIKQDHELLKTAMQTRERINLYFYNLDSKSYEQLSEIEKLEKLKYEIKPLLKDDQPYFISYYDIALKAIICETEETYVSVNEVLDNLGSSGEITHLDLNKINLVSIPSYRGTDLIGYVWAYAWSPQLELNSFAKVSIFFIAMLAFLGIIIILIQKHMKWIQTGLEVFSESIVHSEKALLWSAQDFPELEPVFDKITSYTQELSAINEELGASQRRFTQIMEGISDGLFSIDREWRLLFYNDVAKKYFDKPDEELKMKNILEIFPSFSNTVTYQYIAEVFITAEPAYFEADGMMTSERIFHTSIYPFEEGITVFFRDITEQRQQQHEMARLERLNLVGQMAAGISHEIRNPLTTVKGFLQLRGIKVTDPDEKEYNDLMISEIDRANTIISEFLSLAKDNMGSTQEQDINQIIYRIFPMIQADANNGNKDLILNLNPLPSLWLNENEIRQLLLNFVRNALEVTPQGGCVIIRTYEDKNNVVLAVQDQGCGIPEEIRDKIGTPFFTTKESGTGLGIAISMGIAHRHNAELTFDTGDQGTTFKVIFKRRNILGKKDEGELS